MLDNLCRFLLAEIAIRPANNRGCAFRVIVVETAGGLGLIIGFAIGSSLLTIGDLYKRACPLAEKSTQQRS